MLKVADSADGGFAVTVAVLAGEGSVAIDAPGCPQLGHGWQHVDVAFQPGRLADLLQHQQLIPLEKVVHRIRFHTAKRRFTLRLAAPMQIRRASEWARIRIVHITSPDRLLTTFQGHALAIVGEVVLAIYCRNSGTMENIRITGCVDDHLCAIEAPAGFGIDKQPFTVFTLHLHACNQRIVQDMHTCLPQNLQQFQRKDARGEPAHAAFPVGNAGLAFLPGGRQGIKAIADRQMKQLLSHALDDHPAASIAQGHPEVNQAGGRQTAQPALFLQQQHPPPAACRRQRRRNAGQAAAGYNDLIVS